MQAILVVVREIIDICGYPEIGIVFCQQVPDGRNPEAFPSPQKKVPRIRNGQDHSPPDLSAQETLLSLLATGQIPKDMVSKKDFEDEELKSIYSGLVSGLSPAALVDTAPDEDSRSRYVRILLTPHAENTDQLIAMAQQCLIRIRRASLPGTGERRAAYTRRCPSRAVKP